MLCRHFGLALQNVFFFPTLQLNLRCFFSVWFCCLAAEHLCWFAAFLLEVCFWIFYFVLSHMSSYIDSCMENDLTCHLISSFVHHIPCLDYCGSCFNLSCYAFVFCSAASHPFFLDCLLLSLSWWHVYLLLFLYGFVMATSFGSQGLMVNVMVEIIGLLG